MQQTKSAHTGGPRPPIFRTPTLTDSDQELLAKVESFEANLRYLIRESPEGWQQLLVRNMFARAIQGSILLEGYDVSVDDSVAAADRDEPLDASPEAWDAIMGYRTAMHCVQQLANDPYFRYSADWLRALHFMIVQHDQQAKPSRWRGGSAFVRSEDKNDVLYEPPEARRVPELMDELAAYLNTASDEDETHPIVLSAMAHLNVAMIHPFSDGNGRVARCLQSLVLARAGTHFSESFGIDEYFGRNMKAYFGALSEAGGRKWNPDRDAISWVRFSLGAHLQLSTTLLQSAQQYERLWELLDEQARNVALPSRAALALVDAAVGHSVRNSSYRSVAGVSDQVASRDLALAVRMGLLQAEGDRRGRSYVASPDLKKIAARAMEAAEFGA